MLVPLFFKDVKAIYTVMLAQQLVNLIKIFIFLANNQNNYIKNVKIYNILANGTLVTVIKTLFVIGLN